MGEALHLDPSLALPTAPPGPAGLGVVAPSLAWAGRARTTPFRVAGRRVAVLGDLRAGVTASHTDVGLLTGPLRLWAPGHGPVVAASAVQGPGLLRRELAFPGRTVLETVVLPERLPAFAVQWQAIPAAGPHQLLQVDVALPRAPGGAARWFHQGGTLRVTGTDGDPQGCLLHLDAPGSWSLAAQGDGLLARGEFTVGPGGYATLLVASVDGQGRWPSLAAVAGLEAHRRRSEARGRSAPGLRLETGVTELDDGVAWARALVDCGGQPLSPPPEDPPDLEGLPDPPGSLMARLLEPAARPAWVALAALAAGDFRRARDLLPAPEEHLLAALTRAEWMAWTGDPAPLLEVRRDLAAALGTGGERGAPESLRAFVRRRLAHAAEAAGERMWAAELAQDEARPGRRLPTLASSAGQAGWWEALLGTPAAAVEEPENGHDLPLHAGLLWSRARYALGHPDAAFPALRDALGEAVRQGPPVSPLVPALTLWTLVSGLLGARPDAAFGRLRLAPALPAAWTRFAASGLALGDATLDLAYERVGERRTWRFTPTGGAVPPMLVLEPSFEMAAVTGVQVDGRPADVDLVRHGSRTGVRLQLPLDSERSLTIEGP